jgi:phage tail-like protein
MATADRHDPLRGYNFLVSLSDSHQGAGSALSGFVLSTAGPRVTAGFSEISGLDGAMEVEEYHEGGNNGGALKFAGRFRWSNLIMKRGVLAKRDLYDKSDLWTWLQTFIDGRGVRKDGTITLLDAAQHPALVWGWRRGLPLKWTGPTMNAQQNQIAIEQIEIAHEGVYLIPGGGVLGTVIGDIAGAIF